MSVQMVCNADSGISSHNLWIYKTLAMISRSVEGVLYAVTLFSGYVYLVYKAVFSTNISVKSVYRSVTNTGRPVYGVYKE